MPIPINRVEILGNVTKYLDLKYTNNGKAVVHFTVAVNRKGKDGKPTVDYVPVCLWGKWAENAAASLEKGDPVYVEGRLDVSSYERDGKRKTNIEVVGFNVAFIKRAPKPAEEEAHAAPGVGGPESGDGSPSSAE